MAPQTDHGLRNSWQGALAGGGDPASSPLYVFGPFLSLLAGAGVANVTFGASIWLAVATIIVVSMLYRLVMRWIVDGSGGTGLAEEELGPLAAKVTAALTCIEYTLTFLVSISALVTFIADRTKLDGSLLGLEYRAWVAILTGFVCAFLVSRGPRVVTRSFGPATGAVLALLWIMIIAVIVRRGIHPAPFHLQAFDGKHLGYTLGGFVRILALMTGIEVFANLVASYSGPPEVRSRKAFTSLAIIMSSTAITMVIVGPAILALADPNDAEVSVFTQTMDALLPHPLALAGTVVSVVVLLSAAAASALGIENLFLGLSTRHYAPAAFAIRNRVGVAARPVWSEACAAALLFALLGTQESTYLSIYAAGVFVLLSMTGWAAVLRLVRRKRLGTGAGLLTMVSVVVAAVFTSVATAVLFYERFGDGVWLYALLTPLLAGVFSTVRKARGDPGGAADRMGQLVAAHGANPFQALGTGPTPDNKELQTLIAHLHGTSDDPHQTSLATVYRRNPPQHDNWTACVPLDGSAHAERALPYVAELARLRPLDLELLHVQAAADDGRASQYLELIAQWASSRFNTVRCIVIDGDPIDEMVRHIDQPHVSILFMSTHGRTGLRGVVSGSVTRAVVAQTTTPTVAIKNLSP